MNSGTSRCYHAALRPVSSVVEHFHGKEGVFGSIPKRGSQCRAGSSSARQARRSSSGGQSTRLIIVLSRVRVPPPLPPCSSRAADDLQHPMGGFVDNRITSDRSESDEALVHAAAAGERIAFDELVRRTVDGSYALAVRLVGADDAPDVVQDAYIRAWRSIGKFRGDAVFTTWLYRIVANVALTHRSRKKRFRSVPLEEIAVSHAEDPVATPDSRFSPEAVGDAIQQLPDALRAAVVLHDVYGFSSEEVATTLGISSGAVRVRLHRGRAAVRHTLKEAVIDGK